MNLEGKAVLITGAARRIGRAIAGRLAGRGARLALHYHRSRAEAVSLQRELISRHRVPCELFKADLSDSAQTRRLAAQALKRFGRIDVLVHNASIYERTPVGAAKEAAWDAHMNINARAPFFLSQALAPAMRKAGAGKIIHIADWSAHRPYADYAPYCASKAALLCVNKALARALAPEIQVSAVLPGPVLPSKHDGPEQRAALARANPSRRLGSPLDVAEAVLYLIESSDFVTGVELPVDGGRSIV